MWNCKKSEIVLAVENPGSRRLRLWWAGQSPNAWHPWSSENSLRRLISSELWFPHSLGRRKRKGVFYKKSSVFAVLSQMTTAQRAASAFDFVASVNKPRGPWLWVPCLILPEHTCLGSLQGLCCCLSYILTIPKSPSRKLIPDVAYQCITPERVFIFPRSALWKITSNGYLSHFEIN